MTLDFRLSGATRLNTKQHSTALFQSLLIAEIESGLPLAPRPYAEIADRLGTSEEQVIETLESLMKDGCIKRFGVIVRHRELGYVANAMVVWDIPDDTVDEIGQLYGGAPFVTLCYRRPRRLPSWPYNLFTMIHGLNRDHVLEQVDYLRNLVPNAGFPSATLFSGRRFKQRGARYGNAFVKANSHIPSKTSSSDSQSIASNVKLDSIT